MLSLLTMVGRLISTENPVVCIHFLFPPFHYIPYFFLSINSGRGDGGERSLAARWLAGRARP